MKILNLLLVLLLWLEVMIDTEDSEFFIILKDIPIYNGEYTPIGKVILGLDALKKIKKGNKSNYVLRPDYIKSLKLID